MSTVYYSEAVHVLYAPDTTRVSTALFQVPTLFLSFFLFGNPSFSCPFLGWRELDLGFLWLGLWCFRRACSARPEVL